MAHKRLKDVFHDLGQDVKNAVHHITDDVNHVAEWSLLAPFKMSMYAILKAQGYKPKSMKVEDVARAFHAEIVSKQHHLVDDIVAIVKDILDFFKQLKAKKDSGQTLTDSEQKALNLADKIAGNSNSLSDAASKGATQKDDSTTASTTGDSSTTDPSTNPVPDQTSQGKTDWASMLIKGFLLVLGVKLFVGFVSKK